MPGSVKEGHKLNIVTAVYKISAFINREELQDFIWKDMLTAVRNQIFLAVLMLTVPLKSV